MNSISAIPETKGSQETFYPTPSWLALKMLDGVNWQMVETILEPSAGKGDLAEAVKTTAERKRSWNYSCKLDCVEIDPNLRHILKGKDFRVVHDDFLTFRSYTRYDLIVMNPPFNRGAEHLLKAITMQERGGSIRCLLNAETLRNPCTQARQELAKKLREYNADVEYLDGAFSGAERGTGVTVALVRIDIPNAPNESTLIMDSLKPAHQYADGNGRYETVEITKANMVDALTDRYRYEMEVGLKLIDEWTACRGLIAVSDYSPIIELKVAGHDPSKNAFARQLRRKYWSRLFQQKEFVEGLTSKLQEELRTRVNELADYEFSAYNIYEIMLQMSRGMNESIEATILKLFDEWTYKYHWDERSDNRHYYNGWRTNDAFAVGKKVIIPFYDAFDTWSGKIDQWKCTSAINDVEKVFNFLDGGVTIARSGIDAIKEAAKQGITKNIQCKYFSVTFYKKGTCHIVFNNMEVLEKFNIFAARNKNWLPPTYGKKAYRDMDAEERAVIDSFQGEAAYNNVLRHANYYLATGGPQIAALMSGGEIQ